VYEYRAALIRVVDGDTMHLAIDLGLDIATRMTIRIAGVNAPEMSTPEGQQAKLWAIQWFDDHISAIQPSLPLVVPKWPLNIETIKDKKEKYGRYLGRITAEDGHVYNDDILVASHAIPYNP
jgi:micrococcal nuclease